MKSIIVNVMAEETRMAVLEDQRLTGLELERINHSHLVGNIYKGTVQNVLPGMQAVFVDIGHSKNAFLYVGDGKMKNDGIAGKKIHIGQQILVQVSKDKVGSKGPRATQHLTIPGRNVVLVPQSPYVGTSHRIDDEEERKRLYDIVTKVCPEGMGIIIRTAAIGQSQENIERDIRYLVRVWRLIEAKFKIAKSGALLYRDVDLVIRIVRDIFNETVDLMVIDNEQVYQRVVELVQDISPELTKRVQLYEGRNVFEEYGINQEMEKLGHRIVNLESGGFLVIDKTEALTVIDVNTGSFVGDLNFADTAYALNLEAAEEIMRQLSLRDIGGMIIIDFIDMQKPSQQEDLLKRMRVLAQRDRTKTNVLDITALGLVEITRKKSRHNLDSMLYTDCPICQGSGRIESMETLVIRICREIRQQESIRHCSEGYHILVPNQYVKELKKSQTFATVIKDCGVTLEIEGSKELAPGKYQLTHNFQ